MSREAERDGWDGDAAVAGVLRHHPLHRCCSSSTRLLIVCAWFAYLEGESGECGRRLAHRLLVVPPRRHTRTAEHVYRCSQVLALTLKSSIDNLPSGSSHAFRSNAATCSNPSFSFLSAAEQNQTGTRPRNLD
ncbi:hypothetical protein E2C01_070355 [Portunus trituberculatus]|uniref:Uncharacterized protein n=1 Tax=Portunus trituberculatus TaxID=210409 RepID=A0A5B7I569_PORTR|nr:hypothetical protein [Portunus trituberculatus]